MAHYFEKGDFKRALFYLEKIQHHEKAPPFLNSIINKLKLGIGTDLEAIFTLVKSNFDSAKDQYIKDRLAKDLYAIRAEIDLDCLNKVKRDCRTHDLDGTPYLLKAGKYSSQKEFFPFAIKIKDGVKNSTTK